MGTEGKGVYGVAYRKGIAVYYLSTRSTQPRAVDFELTDPLARLSMLSLMLGRETSFSQGILGYPMLSGLALVLIRIFSDFHPDIEKSLTSACRTIAGLELIRGKFNQVKQHWPKHCHIAPLWAGFLVTSGCLVPDRLLDVDSLLDSYIKTLRSAELMAQMLSFAKPFCDLLRTHQNRKKPLTPDPELTVRIPDEIPVGKLQLFKLTGRALREALPVLR